MSKRKFSERNPNGSFPGRDGAQSLQLTRIFHKFDHGVTLLSRALKTARGFERQKLGRREKTAKAAGQNETLARLAEEVQVLKTLDLTITAQRYLFKQLVKTKRIAETPLFIEFREKKKLALESPSSTAEANVNARLFKSTPVKNVFPEIMSGIKHVLGVRDAPAGNKKKTDAASSETNKKETKSKPTATKATAAAVADISDSEGGDDIRGGGGDGDADSDDESVDMAQFGGRLAPDSDDEEEAEGAGESGSDDDASSDGGVDLRATLPSDMSISRSASPESPPPAKKQKAKAGPVNSTTFLPSLAMGGYFSGSESEPEDMEEQQPKRKNRMGQQARRALWEKKYGAGANHVKKQQQQERNDRNSGWDPRRGAVDSADGRRGGRRGPQRGGAGDGMSRGGHRDRPAAPKPEDNKPLHPSWEAAKKAKEAKSMASFQGKKVVFD